MHVDIHTPLTSISGGDVTPKPSVVATPQKSTRKTPAMSPIVEERNSVVRSKPCTPAKNATPMKSPEQKKTRTDGTPQRLAAVSTPQPAATAKMEVEL